MTTQMVEATIKFSFTDDDITLHIMGAGWTQYEWWYSITFEKHGYYYIEAENPEGDELLRTRISKDDIRRVMGEILSGKHKGTALASEQIMSGLSDGDFDIDADGADIIMQIAVFGEVVYA